MANLLTWIRHFFTHRDPNDPEYLSISDILYMITHKRIVTRVGDVFSVKISESEKKYIQYIASDLTQLNSSVIRVFLETYPLDEKPDMEAVVLGEVDFYAHCVLRWGIEQELFEKAGKSENVGDISKPLFKSTSDDAKVKISHNWWVWRINEEQVYVGKLEEENRKAEDGGVLPAAWIVHRMKTGKYDYVYPDFE